MPVAGRFLAPVALVAALTGSAGAVTLDQAVSLALRHDPDLRQAEARRQAAKARLQEAKAGRFPTLVASGSVATGTTDFGGFFGFGRYDLQPRAAALTLQESLFAGGAISAAIAQARASDEAAAASVDNARLGLMADVAQAYVAVQVARQTLQLVHAQVAELGVVLDQAGRRFQDGEIPRSDVNQAEARLSAGQADLATAEGDVARAEARYRTLVGQDPADLAPVGPPPETPATMAEAVSEAQTNSRLVQAARANVDASDAGVRRAGASRWPTIALVAQGSSIRDQFLPGYRADGLTIGVQGSWTLFDGGRTSGAVSEARADRRAAEAGLDKAKETAEEAAIDAWQARHTADLVAKAAADQATASDSALDSVKNEVRVGQRPTLDLLNAERDALAAHVAVLQATGAREVAAWRLDAVIGRDPLVR